jgi:hypothetical protein
LVIAHDRRNKEPVYLLTCIPVETAEDALLAFGYYLERWGQEEGYRFEKSFLNIENIRTEKFPSIPNLAFLVFLVYFFVSLFYQSNPSIIESLIEKRLKNFVTVKDIQYRYYRVGQLMRLLICEQKNKDFAALLATEVG